MKKYTFTIKGRQYEVDILHVERDMVEVEVNGTHYSVEIHREVKPSKTPTLVRTAAPQPRPEEAQIARAQAKGKPIKAPLPGIIMKIMVKEGDLVKRGDVVLIMEAMKMENNILAEKEGKVVAVMVREGQSVLQNDVLMEVES